MYKSSIVHRYSALSIWPVVMAKKGSCSLSILCFAVLFLSLCKCQGLDGTLGRKPIKGKKSVGFFELHKGNLHINLTNWGATLVSLMTPDKNGHLADVLLGYDYLASYQNISSSRPHFGATIGRVANRIKNAQFTLDGKTYHLVANDGNNSIHGGRIGFDNVLWEVKEIKGGSKPSIKLAYHSFDGEEGFPGDLDVFATYTISNDMELRIDMEAVPRNKATPVSLINHAYWNLAGHDSGRDILDHSVKIWGSHYTPTDKVLIPTGQILPVKGTPLDLRKETVIKSRINKVPSNEVPPGFDHNYVLDSPKSKKGPRVAARAKDPWSSRVLEVWTSAPGLQFYTSNNLKDTVGKGGVIYKPHSSFCFESQAFPNSVNQPNFPSVIVHPGQVYKHTMVIKFSVDL
ncbi:uncharacterized protein LOC131045566 [Cryptomeria japonica]|uniref:uncharacterized protein LOC131045566 n=1 Tax=Cryptomeria japonica TaxID=3369 RepID=UPI0025AC9C31|nr:uncharacterized protein LOC131045566 [Cryptomeria japonica]